MVQRSDDGSRFRRVFRAVLLLCLFGAMLQALGGFRVAESEREPAQTARKSCCAGGGEAVAGEQGAEDADHSETRDDCPCPLDCDKGCVGLKTLALEPAWFAHRDPASTVAELLPRLSTNRLIGEGSSEIFHVPRRTVFG